MKPLPHRIGHWADRDLVAINWPRKWLCFWVNIISNSTKDKADDDWKENLQHRPLEVSLPHYVLFLEHGLEALPHDVVLMLMAALIALLFRELLLCLCLLRHLLTQLLLGSHLSEVLQRKVEVNPEHKAAFMVQALADFQQGSEANKLVLFQTALYDALHNTSADQCAALQIQCQELEKALAEARRQPPDSREQTSTSSYACNRCPKRQTRELCSMQLLHLRKISSRMAATWPTLRIFSARWRTLS